MAAFYLSMNIFYGLKYAWQFFVVTNFWLIFQKFTNKIQS